MFPAISIIFTLGAVVIEFGVLVRVNIAFGKSRICFFKESFALLQICLYHVLLFYCCYGYAAYGFVLISVFLIIFFIHPKKKTRPKFM